MKRCGIRTAAIELETAGTDVETPTESKSGSLKFIKSLSNITKDAGSNVNLRCEVVGDPPPTKIRWFKNEAPLNEEPNRVTIKKIDRQKHEQAARNVVGSRLRIQRLDVNDRGFYSCQAFSGKESIQSEGILQVRVARHGKLIYSFSYLMILFVSAAISIPNIKPNVQKNCILILHFLRY
ncbi:hypothetical protein QAD02_008732 [Eretmocerus hayati]|uniref:Uncharacterized protein n=1 Tax=Eretmocerus hayati TaxID=131215 RepID=A0ACC2N7B7_9HYME|nr:hypothetical protein QAD02_008732 [Eretmocerus hayati]